MKKLVQKSSNCQKIPDKNALQIVQNLPEVKEFLNTKKEITKNQTSEAKIIIDSQSPSRYLIHVYSLENYPNSPNLKSHTSTFNWYLIDKCSGAVKCSFSIYENGKFIRVSNPNKYPCH